MAATVSTNKPTRVSERIRNLKKDAAAAPAATVTTTTNTRKGKDKANRKATPAKITKRTPTKKASPLNAKTYAAHHRFFMEPEQFSTMVEQHNADDNDQMWVSGKFYAAGPGEEAPAGSIEIDIKVPSGLRFLVFPGVLRLVEQEEEEEEDELSE
jgi:hypothetical protein